MPTLVEEKPQVLVLLATYDGERFVREQIDSLLAQTYQPLRILARDDGSTDGTRAILEEYAERYPQAFAVLPPGAPTGSAKQNFHKLLVAALEEQDPAPYMAFCDQDDFWVADKIALEIKAMRKGEQDGVPRLIFSDLRLVNDDLSTRHASFWGNQGINPANVGRFRRLLAQNVVTGCTAVINLPLARLAVRMPEDAFMHDWWVALLAAAFGQADYVAQQTVFYRQHGGNVLGMVVPPKNNLIPKFRYHVERRAQWEMAAHQAEALLRVHGSELAPKRLRTLKRYLRAEQSPNRVVRTFSFIAGGYWFNTFRGNLVMLWYLWDMDEAKRS